MSDLRKEIERAINRCSAENGSNTPDFILAQFLTTSLQAFDTAVNRRDEWYGINPIPGRGIHGAGKPIPVSNGPEQTQATQ